METYQEFLDRINSFEKHFSLGQGDFSPNQSVLHKTAENNSFSPFYGDTTVFVLNQQEQAFFKTYTDRLYQEVPECFAERIKSETFHMTLHDLSNSPDEIEVIDEMKANEAKLRGVFRTENPVLSEIHMKYNAVFNLVHTALVIGLYPADETEYQKLMQLYELVNQVKKLNYPLTPHITLGYYSRKGFPASSARKLAQIVHELNQNPADVMLSPERLFYQHFTSMADYQNIFCLEGLV